MAAIGMPPTTNVKIVFRNKEVMKIPGAKCATATGRQHSGQPGCRDYMNVFQKHPYRRRSVFVGDLESTSDPPFHTPARGPQSGP